MRPSAEKKEQLQVFGKLQGLKNSLTANENQIPKRQAQRLRKEYSAIEMYFFEEKKRGVIAKALGLSPDEVGKIIKKFKRDLNQVVEALTLEKEKAQTTSNSNQNCFQITSEKLESILCERKKEKRALDKHSKSKNPELLKALSNHFDKFGIYQMSSDKIRSELIKDMDERLVPSSVVLRKMMKETFNLKYTSLEMANLKYRDPAYNEKRLWVSRLLAQFITEDAIIVSIDESNFKHDAVPKKQWQFNQSKLQLKSEVLGKRKKTTDKKKKHLGVLNATDDMLEPPSKRLFNSKET